MKRTFLLCLTALCLSASLNLLPTYSQQTAQNADWKVLLDSARSFQEQEKDDSALSYGLRAVEAMKKRTSQHPDTNYVIGLSLTSALYLGEGKYLEAESYCSEAYTLSKALYKIDHIEKARATKNLARFYKGTAKYAEAEPLYIEALSMYRRLFINDHPLKAGSINNLGLFYCDINNYTKAEPLLLEALAMYRRLYKTDDPSLANSLISVADFYSDIEDPVKAESFFIEALEMRRRLFKTDHIDVSTSLGNLGLFYKEQGNYDKAERFLTESLAMTRRIYGGDHDNVRTDISNLGLLYYVMGNFVKARPLYEEALAMARRLFKNDHPSLSNSIYFMGAFYFVIGEYDKVESLMLEGIEMNRRLYKNGHFKLASSINNLAVFYDSRGRYSNAEPLYAEALAINRKIYTSDNSELALLIRNMGLYYKKTFEYAKAEPLLEEALAMYRRVFKKDHTELAHFLTNLGVFYQDRADYNKAEPLFLESLAMYRRLFKEDHPDVASAIESAGTFYRLNGNSEKAKVLLEEALAMYRRIFKSDHINVALTLNKIGQFYKESGEYGKAESVLRESVEMYRRIAKNTDNADLATTIASLSELYFSQGLSEKAEILQKEAFEMRKRIYSGRPHPQLVSAIYSRAISHQNKNNVLQANSLYNEALQMNLKILDNFFIYLSESEKQAYWGSILGYFEKYNSFSCDHSSDQPNALELMYNNQLATKGLLLSATQKVKSRIAGSGDTAIVGLLRVWQTQKEQISKFSRLTVAELDKKRINLDSLENLANTSEKELSRRSEVFATAFDNTRASWRDVQKTLKADEAAIEIVRFRHFGSVPNKFDTTVRVMDYVPDSIRYAALILTPKTNNQPELVMLPDGSKLEKEWLQRYKTSILGSKGTSANTAADNDSYNAYWKPIAEKLKKLSPKLKTVYIAPDGAYNQVNLSTLYNPATKKYVLDELDVRTVTNTKDLLQAANAEQGKKILASLNAGAAKLFGYPDFNLDTASYTKARLDMLALARANSDTRSADVAQISSQTQTQGQAIPEDRALANLTFGKLPGTKTEIEEVSNLLTKNKWLVQAHTGAEALEEAVKAVNNPRVLHIATHGFFLPNADRETDGKYKAGQNPLLRSGLALSGANRKLDATATTAEDGILTAYEAMNLNLDKTELVVLSACETGVGEVKNGEGVYGLQRAFKVAGAKSLIMSLWAVSDNATQKLMVEFYRQWTAGKSKRAALRAAQNVLRADARYKAPYYWGAFVLVGE